MDTGARSGREGRQPQADLRSFFPHSSPLETPLTSSSPPRAPESYQSRPTPPRPAPPRPATYLRPHSPHRSSRPGRRVRMWRGGSRGGTTAWHARRQPGTQPAAAPASAAALGCRGGEGQGGRRSSRLGAWRPQHTTPARFWATLGARRGHSGSWAAARPAGGRASTGMGWHAAPAGQRRRRRACTLPRT